MYEFIFFFNDTATTEIYTLSLHDALPISAGCAPCSTAPTRRWSAPRRCSARRERPRRATAPACCGWAGGAGGRDWPGRRPGSARARATGGRCPRTCGGSEEHTSELQSLAYLVCRLLLEKKKIT